MDDTQSCLWLKEDVKKRRGDNVRAVENSQKGKKKKINQMEKSGNKVTASVKIKVICKYNKFFFVRALLFSVKFLTL